MLTAVSAVLGRKNIALKEYAISRPAVRFGGPSNPESQGCYIGRLLSALVSRRRGGRVSMRAQPPSAGRDWRIQAKYC